MRPLSDARLVEFNTIFLLYKEITTDYVLFFFFFFFILLVALVVRMMHCTAPASGCFGGEMSVLARQKARLRWQGVQGQEEVVMVMMQSSGQSFPADVRENSTLAYQHFPAGVFPQAAKSDPELDNGWPDFTGAFLSPAAFSGEHGVSAGAESFASISRTASCPAMVGNAAAPVLFPPEKVPPPASKRKRKAVEKAAVPTRTMPMEDYKDKKEKREAQEDQAEFASKQSDQSSMNKPHNSSNNIKAAKKEASVDTSKDNSKASEVQQKPDYIHVRAWQGQATGSQSLAERVRREKIIERMKYLQDLVPGCNKVSGKAGMLDVIINYVQSLQRQLETMPMEDYKDKKVNGEAQEDQAELAPKQSDQYSMNKPHNSSKNIKAANKEASVDESKDKSKASGVQQKPDNIHVKARRGQATDSHSLAERVRREKISERMKYLQDLVPGCTKVIGKAGMLDVIINYVQSLQRQVEFLSMKLATVNPRLDNIDDFLAKEMFPASTDPLPQVSMLPDLTNQAFLHHNPPQPVVSCGGLNVATNPLEISVRRTPCALLAAPDGFLDTCSNGGQASSSATGNIDLHTLHNAELHQGRQSPIASQQCQGNIQVNDIKMEM